MASRLQRLITRAGTSENHLSGQLTPSIEAARDAWLAAGEEASDFVRQVIRLNPLEDIESILERPEVRQALSVPFREARIQTLASINHSWDVGVAAGRASGQADLSILGFGNTGGTASPPTTYLDSLLSDARRNAGSARTRFEEALRADETQAQAALDSITRDLSRRAGIGANAAGHRAMNETKEEMFILAAEENGQAIRKVWVTRFRPTTCRTCAKLHGTVIKVRGEFSHTAHYGSGNPPLVYGDLLGPPRHPHCGCRIVPWIASMADDDGVSIQSMKDFATGWLATHY